MEFRAFVFFLTIIIGSLYPVKVAWTQGPVASSPLWVVGESGLPLSSISQDQIIHILNMDSRIWTNGDAIHVALLSTMLEEDDQWVRWLGLSSVEPLLTRWIEADLIQDWPPPKRFSSVEALLKFVQNTPGAVGFINIPPRSLPADLRTISIEETEARHKP